MSYKTLRESIIEDLYDYNVFADVSIESLADDIMDIIRNTNGREYVKAFHTCPMCTDCPDNCPIEK